LNPPARVPCSTFDIYNPQSKIENIFVATATATLYYSVLNDLDAADISVIVNFFYCAKNRKIFLDEKPVNLVKSVKSVDSGFPAHTLSVVFG